VIGSRKRICINDQGAKNVPGHPQIAMHVECRRIHHELPDKLVPYKRHVSESIEAVVTGEPGLSIPADEATLAACVNNKL
jgi:hypothetical protein